MSFAGLAQFTSDVERWSEIAVEQVAVHLERERGGVVAHPTLQPQRGQARFDSIEAQVWRSVWKPTSNPCRDSRREREAKRRHRVRDRAVAQSAARSRPVGQPVDEVLDRDAVEIAHADAAAEVRSARR